jgi:hypothetical protein
MKTYTVKINDYGDKEWYHNDKFHRTDGPAIERANGYKSWYLNGKLHRTDGPAIEWANGHKEWWLNGKFHREDGPAIEYANGTKAWYLNGKKYTEAEFNNFTLKGENLPIKPLRLVSWTNKTLPELGTFVLRSKTDPTYEFMPVCRITGPRSSVGGIWLDRLITDYEHRLINTKEWRPCGMLV